MTARSCGRRRTEQGAAAVELALVAPVLVVVMLFVVGLGRMADARQQLESVAADSARAASLVHNTALSREAARRAASASLGRAGVSCQRLEVRVDTSGYTPGGQVRVRVSCRAQLSDLGMSGFPGSRTFTAEAASPVSSWRTE